MKQDFWKRGIVFAIILLLFGAGVAPSIIGDNAHVENRNDASSDDTVIICLKRYDDKEGLIDDPIGSVSMEDAYILKNELENIWQKHIPISEKTRKSVILLDKIENLQLPLGNILKTSYYQNEPSQSNTSQLYSDNSDDVAFNFITLWGAFCVGQPNIYIITGNRTLKKYVITETPASETWNISFFIEYGIGAILFPFLAWGYFGTAGLFGINTLQIPPSTPNFFLSILIGALFLGFSFKVGDPYISIFEVYVGGAGFALGVPM